MKPKEFLNPPPALLAKLGSVVVHVEEMLGPGGHNFDRYALNTAMNDPEVREWLSAGRKLAMIPEKRPMTPPVTEQRCGECGDEGCSVAPPAPVAPASEEPIDCPFCGSPAAMGTYTDYDGDEAYTVPCSNSAGRGFDNIDCPGFGLPDHFDRDEAVAAWNTRAALTSERTRTRERIEELERALRSICSVSASDFPPACRSNVALRNAYLDGRTHAAEIARPLIALLDAWEKELR